MVVFTQLADRLRGENVHIDDGYRKLIMASQPMQTYWSICYRNYLVKNQARVNQSHKIYRDKAL